jgi:16S rRNA (adenine1518-N6/adenine1519-N6)-dimethyltransferase
MDLANKENLIGYLKKNGLWARKGLSQNFLVDRDALEKIIEAGKIKADDLIIEIGPGTGVLTSELVEVAGEVIAIELDNNLAQLLNCTIVKLLGSPSNSAIQQFSNSKLKVINANILKINLNELIGDRKYKVIANIPYHITSKILELFLSQDNKPETMVLLVQKEVAERVCASPRLAEQGDRRGKPGEMSTLSVSVQLYGEPEIVGIVKKDSFFPLPKVDSAILRITVDDKPSAISNEKSFFRLVHIGFASRRKTLVNNLSAGCHIPKEEASDIIKKAGLSENTRAQELSIEEWKKLNNITNEAGKNV